METMYYVIGGIAGLLIVWALGSYLAVRSLEEPSYTWLLDTSEAADDMERVDSGGRPFITT